LPVVAGVIIASGVSNFHLQFFWIVHVYVDNEFGEISVTSWFC
jgi:hypothetical protein